MIVWELILWSLRLQCKNNRRKQQSLALFNFENSFLLFVFLFVVVFIMKKWNKQSLSVDEADACNFFSICSIFSFFFSYCYCCHIFCKHFVIFFVFLFEIYNFKILNHSFIFGCGFDSLNYTHDILTFWTSTNENFKFRFFDRSFILLLYFIIYKLLFKSLLIFHSFFLLLFLSKAIAV